MVNTTELRASRPAAGRSAALAAIRLCNAAGGGAFSAGRPPGRPVRTSYLLEGVMSTREYVMSCTGFAFDGEVGGVKTAGSVAQRVLSQRVLGQRSCAEDEEEGRKIFSCR